MDPVSLVQKNVTRIRTFKDDVLRAQGSTVQSGTAVSEAERKTPAATPTVRIASSPLTQKNYTPLPNPNQTSAPLPKGERPAYSADPISVLRDKPSVPKVPFTPKQTLTVPLSKSEMAQIATVQKTSILSDEGTLHSEHSLGEGTIVRDKKRNRTKFFPALATALSSWFSQTKTEYQKAVRGPVHTVAKAESRLETIRKAIEQGRQAPKDDFAQVSASLKTTPRAQIQSAVIVKEKTELPIPTWSYVVGEHDVVETTPVVRVPIIETADVEVVTPTPTDAVSEEEYVSEIPQPPVVARVEEVYVPETPQPPLVAEVEAPQNVPVRSQQYAPAREPSERPFYIALALIVFVATLLGVGVSYYFFGKTNTGVVVKDEVTYEAPKLFTANNTYDFALPNDRLALLSVLESSTQENSDAVVHLYPTLGEEVVAADVESILTVLGPRAPGSFLRGVKEIAFGGAYGEPFIVLTTSSFDTAFSGMLSWEEAMSADLSPLFGSPVSSSFNPEVRTNTGTSAAFFKDIIANNKNARLLVDENGDDRIIYTFINQNTVVITTTREALSDIIPLLK